MKIWAGLLCAGALLAQSSFAAHPVTNAPSVALYSLDDCIRIGLERSSSALNARRDEEIAEARIMQSRAEVLPGLTAAAGYTRLDQVSSFDMNGSVIPMGMLDNYSSSITVDQLLYSGGRAGAALRAARIYRDLAKVGLDNAHQALKRDITTSFNDLLLAKASVQVLEESVGQLVAAADEAEQKYRAGLMSEFDWLSIRVRLVNERPRLTAARSGLQTARESFRILLRIDGEFDLNGDLICEPVPVTDIPALKQAALSRRPAVLQLKARMMLREEDAVASKGNYFPEFRAFGSYAGSDPDQSAIGSDEWGWHWTAGLTMKWTLFDGLRTPGLVREKKLEVEKAREDLEDLGRMMMLEIDQSAQEMTRASEAIAGGTEAVQLAEKALAIARERFEQGLSTALEFSEANLALSSTRLSYWTALRDYRNAECRLRYASGTLE